MHRAGLPADVPRAGTRGWGNVCRGCKGGSGHSQLNHLGSEDVCRQWPVHLVAVYPPAQGTQEAQGAHQRRVKGRTRVPTHGTPPLPSLRYSATLLPKASHRKRSYPEDTAAFSLELHCNTAQCSKVQYIAVHCIVLYNKHGRAKGPLRFLEVGQLGEEVGVGGLEVCGCKPNVAQRLHV